MLGSAVQVRPLLPSTKKAAYRTAFFVRPSSGIRSCGSGPSPRKGGFEPPGRIPEASFSSVRCSVSETRGNGGAFRDRSSHPWPLLVWPSLAKQLPPGTTIAPLTWQRHRHGSDPPSQRKSQAFEFSKERRDLWRKRSLVSRRVANATLSRAGPARTRAGYSERSEDVPSFWVSTTRSSPSMRTLAGGALPSRSSPKYSVVCGNGISMPALSK